MNSEFHQGGAGTHAGGDRERTVLLVERDDGLREPFALWLRDRWNVVTAADARSALASVAPSIDVVVTSDRLLLRSPEKFLSDVSDRGYTGPVIVLGTRSRPPDVDGVDVTFVPKPIGKRELLDLVAGALE